MPNKTKRDAPELFEDLRSKMIRPAPSPLDMNILRPTFGVVALVSVLMLVVFAMCERRPEDLEVEDTQVPEWLLAGPGDAGVVAKKMPSKRMKGQQAAPCEPTHVLLNDGCWAGVTVPPPCGEFYENSGKCYVPIVEKKKLPTSVGE